MNSGWRNAGPRGEYPRPGRYRAGRRMSNVERLYQTVPDLVKQWVFGGECETPIRKAMHGDSSGVRGAAWLWPLQGT